jgi:poly-gamma-glutamate capsule biosynthesis protein CapA/YwtB (metallophosphatase superfamily)
MFLTRCLKWATYSRFKPIRNFAWKLIEPEGHVFSPSDSAVRILVGGDVTFDPENRLPHGGVYFLKRTRHRRLERIRRRFWRILCRFFLSPKFFSDKIFYDPYLRELRMKEPENEERGLIANHPRGIYFDIDYSSATSKFAYPLEKIAPLMKKEDLVLVNLETPLTSHPRVQGHFISDPRYAQAMKDAGISIVNLANNHIFDVGDVGLSDTLNHLKDAGIAYIGAGKNFEDARLGKLLELNGIKLSFLSYTNVCNKGFVSVAAEYPGVLPLDPHLILADIKVARQKADFVFVSLHWGSEDQPNVHPRQIEIAHLLIDAGADGIIGHHPHVPHGIEIYKKRPILYSLGNFIFGHGSNQWSDNFLAEIIIDQKHIQGIIIYPISGEGQGLFQPELLSGARADSLLHELQIKSVVFDTGIAIQNHIGYIEISARSMEKETI